MTGGEREQRREEIESELRGLDELALASEKKEATPEAFFAIRGLLLLERLCLATEDVGDFLDRIESCLQDVQLVIETVNETMNEGGE